MPKKTNQTSCLEPSNIGSGCCKVESVVTMDSKGQLLLPKEVRERANLKAGDKLVVVNMADNQETCCIVLIKTEYFGSMVKNFLGPVMGDLLKE